MLQHNERHSEGVCTLTGMLGMLACDSVFLVRDFKNFLYGDKPKHLPTSLSLRHNPLHFPWLTSKDCCEFGFKFKSDLMSMVLTSREITIVVRLDNSHKVSLTGKSI